MFQQNAILKWNSYPCCFHLRRPPVYLLKLCKCSFLVITSIYLHKHFLYSSIDSSKGSAVIGFPNIYRKIFQPFSPARNKIVLKDESDCRSRTALAPHPKSSCLALINVASATGFYLFQITAVLREERMITNEKYILS